MIKAKALKGIAGVEKGPKRSVLYSLIDHSLPLAPDEEKTYREIIQENPMFQEAKMLQSIEEVGIEKGMEKGIDIGVEKTVMQFLRAQVLSKEQIAHITGMNMEDIEKLGNKLKEK